MKNILGLFVLAFFIQGCGCTVVDPGNVGVKVTLGDVDSKLYQPGLVTHTPVVGTVHEVSVRQQTRKMKSEDYSSDLQQVIHDIDVIYRIPEENVLTLFQKYQEDPWEGLIEPRVQEALKAASSKQTAENLVKNRQELKAAALVLVREKLKDLIAIEDIVIANDHLSTDLEKAIEAKMVQQQEAEKALFIQNQTRTEADTAAIKANGEAQAISIRGKALKENPGVVDLMIVEHWNGVTPLVIGSASGGTSVILPLKDK